MGAHCSRSTGPAKEQRSGDEKQLKRPGRTRQMEGIAPCIFASNNLDLLYGCSSIQ